MDKEEKFNIKISEIDKIIIVELYGYLDAHTAPKFEKELEKLISENKYQIVVNFKNLDYISSAGLGVFMGYIEQIRNNNGDIKLAEMKLKIFSVFDLLGFPTLFEIFTTENEAIEKFKNYSND